MAPDSLSSMLDKQLNVESSRRELNGVIYHLKAFNIFWNKKMMKKQAIILHIFRSLICTLIKNVHALEEKSEANVWTKDNKNPRIIILE